MIITRNILEELNTEDGHIGTIKYTREISTVANDRPHATVEVLKRIGADNIIHVGCCNHILEIDRLIREGKHLQLLLQENFKNVIGFDINQEAIEYFVSKGGVNIHLNDMTEQIDQTNFIIENMFGGGVTLLF